jgi:hypothetical protein
VVVVVPVLVALVHLSDPRHQMGIVIHMALIQVSIVMWIVVMIMTIVIIIEVELGLG